MKNVNLIYKIVAYVLIIFIPCVSTAKFYFNVEYGGVYDKSNQFSSSKSSQTFFISNIVFQLNTNSNFYFKAGYIHWITVEPISSADTSTMTTDLLYSALKFCFTKDYFLCLGGGIAPYGQAIYTQTSSSLIETWMAQIYIGEVSIRNRITPRLLIDINLYYLNNVLSQKRVNTGSTYLTTVDQFSRSLVIPTIGLEYEF